jgi:hypothetical protein
MQADDMRGMVIDELVKFRLMLNPQANKIYLQDMYGTYTNQQLLDTFKVFLIHSDDNC